MAIRKTTHILKNSDIINRPLPATLLKGEPIINTADGIMYFSGVTTSTSGWTQSSPSTPTFFEVGSNLYDLKLRNKITTYNGLTNLSGKFLSGTTSGFVLGDISSISGVDTYVTGFTYTPTNNTFTIKQNVGQPDLTVGINSFSGLTVNGNLVANTISATTYNNLPIDVRITSGTHNNGTSTFTNNTGGTFSVSGYFTGSTEYWTSGSTGLFSIKANNDSGTDANGNYSVAEGYKTTAIGDQSHAEGVGTQSLGISSHAEGDNTTSSGQASHSEGNLTTAQGDNSHAEGTSTIAVGVSSHAEGGLSIANGDYAHAEGYATFAGEVAHAEGNTTTATQNGAHAGGSNTVANGTNSFVHGNLSHANGDSTIVLGDNIIGNTANTVYVPKLNIGIINTGTSVTTLGVDASGNVVSSNDTYVTGFTYTPLTNNLTIKQNFGQPNLTVGINSFSGLSISNLIANRLVYTTTGGQLITGTATFDGTDVVLPSTGSLSVGTGGLVIGSGGSPSVAGTGDLVVNGSLTVFGGSVSAFTNNLYVEDNNLTLNYNPTGNTIVTSIGAGITVQDGNGVSLGDVNFNVNRLDTLTGIGSFTPDVTEYVGSTGFANRGWVTQLNDIVIRSTNVSTPNGVRVLTEGDVLNAGEY